MTNKTIAIALLFGLLLFSYAFPASAHLSSGEHKEVGGYLIDFSYEPDPIAAQEPFTLSLNLVNASTSEQLAPKKVWVRISNDDGVAFAATFYPEPMNVMWMMSLPTQGPYEVDVRFFEEGPKAIASAKFPLIVRVQKDIGKMFVWMLGILGLAIIGIIAWVWHTAKSLPHMHKGKK